MRHVPVQRLLALAALLLASPVARAQNYLSNPGFDADLSGWQLSGAVLPEWDSKDVLDAPGSGSALVTNAETGESSDVEVLSQCIVIVPGQHRWSTWVFIPSGQARTGSVVLRYRYYANSANCTGGINGIGGHEVSAPLDVWVQLQGNPIAAAGGGVANSISYVIAVRKTEAGGQFQAYVDDTYLYKHVVFKDSFE